MGYHECSLNKGSANYMRGRRGGGGRRREEGRGGERKRREEEGRGDGRREEEGEEGGKMGEVYNQVLDKLFMSRTLTFH